MKFNKIIDHFEAAKKSSERCTLILDSLINKYYDEHPEKEFIVLANEVERIIGADQYALIEGMFRHYANAVEMNHDQNREWLYIVSDYAEQTDDDLRTIENIAAKEQEDVTNANT